jgi:hypothetical protein
MVLMLTAACTEHAPNRPPTSGSGSTHEQATATAQGAASTSKTSPLAGEWYRHGVSLTIDGVGHGTLTFRTYATCPEDPPPCDTFSGHSIIDGGNATLILSSTGPTTASGRVLTTTAPTAFPVGRLVAQLDTVNGLLYLSPSDSEYFPLFPSGEFPLCGASSPSEAPCGA